MDVVEDKSSSYQLVRPSRNVFIYLGEGRYRRAEEVVEISLEEANARMARNSGFCATDETEVRVVGKSA